MEKAIELFKEKRYTDLLDYLETINPLDYLNSDSEYIRLEHYATSVGINLYEEMLENLSSEQYKKYRWLESGEREYEYILNNCDEDEQAIRLRAFDY